MTLASSDYVFAFVFPTGGPMTTGTGFTSRATAGGIQEDDFPVSGSITPTAHDGTNNDPYGFIAVAIKPAGGAAAKTCTLTTMGAGPC
jgi:hypothetical protein